MVKNNDDRPDTTRGYYETQLELDPSDKQAHRFPLMSLLLQQGDTRAARALSDRFAGNCATMAWARVVLCWLEGNHDAARQALDTAATSSPLVATRLFEGRLRREELPAQVTPGTWSEAPMVLECLVPAIEAQPEFTPWLAGALSEWDLIRVREWIEGREKQRGETAPASVMNIFTGPPAAHTWLTPYTGAPPSDSDIDWLRQMAEAEDLHPGDAPGFGYASAGALSVLGAVRSAENAQWLVDLLVDAERTGTRIDGDVVFFREALEGALESMGPLAVAPALAALDAGHEDEDGGSWLLFTLANAGVRDERIATRLLDGFSERIDGNAELLGDYGDPAMLPLLGATLDSVLARSDCDVEWRDYEVVALTDAIETIGGTLTPAQEEARFKLAQTTSNFALQLQLYQNKNNAAD